MRKILEGSSHFSNISIVNLQLHYTLEETVIAVQQNKLLKNCSDFIFYHFTFTAITVKMFKKWIEVDQISIFLFG